MRALRSRSDRCAGYFGIHPPGFVAEVVAFAFESRCSLAVSSDIHGHFCAAHEQGGAIEGMLSGLSFYLCLYSLFPNLLIWANNAGHWFNEEHRRKGIRWVCY